MKKFELTTKQKINWFGHTLYRIKACISFTTTDGFDVKVGDLGGWVEKEQNLSHEGKAWVWGNAKVWGNAEVCGDAKVWGNAKVFSTEHIFCVTPIGASANSMTVFRTKNRKLEVSFEYELCSIDEFEEDVEDWGDEKQRKVALAALNIAKMHIDLTPEETEWKPCPFGGGNAEFDSEAEIVVCQECGACSPMENWNNR